MNVLKVGSICSGIEAASVAWNGPEFDFEWFSEIEKFPSKLLQHYYPNIPNLGDMKKISSMLKGEEISSPDLICAGTPCQAFSLAGWKKGLSDDRGNLTLQFVDIVIQNDRMRLKNKLDRTIVFWENVEGVLRDKTNSFGNFLASLAGLNEALPKMKWPTAGLVRGPDRNIAWRILDAKYFGLPQQRRRLYVLAGGKNFFPEKILFEEEELGLFTDYGSQKLEFKKNGCAIKVFRSYTDCLYSAYGTKWNGNAAANNGSLFVSQDGRLRRFSPLETERLMGFPDNYTNLEGVRPTNRYQALGNSWAVPVVKWIGSRLITHLKNNNKDGPCFFSEDFSLISKNRDYEIFDMTQASSLAMNRINASPIPSKIKLGDLKKIIDVKCPEKFYISPVGCKGILRRRDERGTRINPELEVVLEKISSGWSDDKIEALSRRQKRGKLSS